MTYSDHTIFYISGAGLSPWIWDEVRAELESPSQVALPPVNRRQASLREYAEAAFAGALTLEPLTLGTPISSRGWNPW